MTSTLQTAHMIGEFIDEAGGYFAGILNIRGVPHQVITAPKSGGELKGCWLKTYSDVPGAASYFDSTANTLAMAQAGSPIAKQALAATINGHADWAIPARDALELMYRAHKPTTEENYRRCGDNPSSVPTGYPYTLTDPAQALAPAFQEGGAEAFEASWYWSSTQYSDNYAWTQDFDYGYQNDYSKKAEGRVRLVRLIQLSA